VAKNRNGPRGTVTVTWIPMTMSFTEEEAFSSLGPTPQPTEGI
jgi:hypothetical protein